MNKNAVDNGFVCGAVAANSGAYDCGADAVTTMLTKNTFLEEIRKQYVLTARAKGLAEIVVLTALAMAQPTA